MFQSIYLISLSIFFRKREIGESLAIQPVFVPPSCSLAIPRRRFRASSLGRSVRMQMHTHTHADGRTYARERTRTHSESIDFPFPIPRRPAACNDRRRVERTPPRTHIRTHDTTRGIHASFLCRFSSRQAFRATLALAIRSFLAIDTSDDERVDRRDSVSAIRELKSAWRV